VTRTHTAIDAIDALRRLCDAVTTLREDAAITDAHVALRTELLSRHSIELSDALRHGERVLRHLAEAIEDEDPEVEE
jgi:hypothetical protein